MVGDISVFRGIAESRASPTKLRAAVLTAHGCSEFVSLPCESPTSASALPYILAVGRAQGGLVRVRATGDAEAFEAELLVGQ